MSKEVVALGDVGATQTRLSLKDLSGQTVGELFTKTDVTDYEGSINSWADTLQAMAEGHRMVGAALAIAARVDSETGRLDKAGDLTPWTGRRPGHDLGHLLGISVDTLNDVEAIAVSQQYINIANNRSHLGVATTLSSGWGAARYDTEFRVWSDEPGHEFLREGAVCPCGGEGHAEAWISGKGKQKNTGMTMNEWLKLPGHSTLLANDIAEAVTTSLKRYESQHDFWPEEIRWTGGVALGQPFVMQDAAGLVRYTLGKRAPAFDIATMGEQAGLHGSFVRAVKLAQIS